MQLRSTIIAVALAALVGCGLKGPLYLPGEKDQREAASQGRADKTRRPQPAPQAQKEEHDAATQTDPHVTPVDLDRPNPAPTSGTP
jgi:predicted small lipoprotein YifL